MSNWLIIRCPNQRQHDQEKLCSHVLKAVDGLQKNHNEIIRCEGCKAQCYLSFDEKGTCNITVLKERVHITSVNYPSIGKGKYIKRRQNG